MIPRIIPYPVFWINKEFLASNVNSEVHYLCDHQQKVNNYKRIRLFRDVVLCEETLGTSDKKSTGNFAQITQSLLTKFPPQAKHNFHYDKYILFVFVDG